MKRILVSLVGLLIGMPLAAGDLVNPSMTLEAYKAVLKRGNCEEIIKVSDQLYSTQQSFRPLYVRIGSTGRGSMFHSVEFFMDSYCYSCGPYKNALHDFFLQDLLRPAMFGNVNIAKACDNIKRLVSQNHGSGITQGVEFITDAIKHARNVPHTSGTAPAELQILVKYVKNRTTFWTPQNKKRVGFGVAAGIALTLAACYAAYKYWWSGENKEDECAHDEENVENSEKQPDGSVPVA